MLDVGCWMLDSFRANGCGDGVGACGRDHANGRDDVRASGYDGRVNDRDGDRVSDHGDGCDALCPKGERRTSRS